MAWIYNHRTGTLMEQLDPIAQLEIKANIGWHGPFKSKDEAVAYYEANKKSDWVKPTNYLQSFGNLPGAVGGLAGDAARNAADSAVKAISPFSDQNLQAWFIRIGEIILGVVLVGVGLAKLTGNPNTVSKIVKVSKSVTKSG